MNVAALFNLYKSINPPVYADHATEVLHRIQRELQTSEELRAKNGRSSPCPDEQDEPMHDAVARATRLRGLAW